LKGNQLAAYKVKCYNAKANEVKIRRNIEFSAARILLAWKKYYSSQTFINGYAEERCLLIQIRLD